MTEDEMVGWHHQLNGHEFEQTPGGSDGQRNLACYSPCSQKDSDTTEQLNNATWKQVCVCDVSTSRIDFGTIDFFLELLEFHGQRPWRAIVHGVTNRLGTTKEVQHSL